MGLRGTLRLTWLAVGLLALGRGAGAQAPAARAATAAAIVRPEAPIVRPYEQETWATPANGVDTRVVAALQQAGLAPAHPCSDEVFIRRVYLDVIGTLPEPADVRRFLQDPNPAKRAALIDALLARDEFTDYWTLKWGDMLRVKSEFPINLWPNAVQAYSHWIRESVRANLPYDQFARALLTSSGSNFKVPPVNFYRAVQDRTPPGLAAAVAQTFMGVRLAGWTADQRADLANFFSRLAYKHTGEWKEEIIYLDFTATGPLAVTFPDGTKAVVPAGEDPRVALADWLIRPENPYFTRALVNRVWDWVFGRGIIANPDDIHPDSPPANPELLSYLQQQFVAEKYDLRALFRLILNSRTYQQSALPQSTGAQATALGASYPVRRLPAEVMIDALDWVGGTEESYVSAVPEPFTWLPGSRRSIGIPDGSITSANLMMFGRPSRDSGLEAERINQPSDAQELFLLNSSDVQRRIAHSPRLQAVLATAAGDQAQIIRGTYLTLLDRDPLPAEQAAAEKYWLTPGLSSTDAATDLAWALVNSAEFEFRH